MISNLQGDSILNPFSMWQWWQKQIQASMARLPMPSGFLNEPILPNGTFAGIVINENNSDDPQAEQAIVSQYSYGKQLGQLIDAVDILIKERPASEAHPVQLVQLQKLKKEIDTLKGNVARSRLERIQSDLALLDQADLIACKKRIDKLIA